MLLYNPTVLDGHLPTRKLDYLRPVTSVQPIESGSLEPLDLRCDCRFHPTWLNLLAAETPRRPQGIEEKHADRHRTDSAGDRRDPGGAIFGALELDIAHELTAGEPIAPDVDHHRARLDPITADQSCLTDGDD